MDEFQIASWNDFIGQAHLKEILRIHINAAKQMGRPLDPVLLVGPTGFGKTTLASVIADELGEPLTIVGMPITEKALFRLCEDFEGVVFFDEIHRARPALQECLLPLLQSGYVENSAGIKRYSANTTYIAATTEPKKVIKPLWDRFPIRPDFDDYTDEEMGRIVGAMAVMAGVKLSRATAETLGRATGGTPRCAGRFVLAARDLTVENRGKTPDATIILDFCRVDESGITRPHLDYLKALEALGGTAGLTTLSSYLHFSESVVCELEPMLLDQKLVRFTSSGRELTRKGQLKVEHLSAKPSHDE